MVFAKCSNVDISFSNLERFVAFGIQGLTFEFTGMAPQATGPVQ